MFCYHRPIDVIWNPVIRFVAFGDWGLGSTSRSQSLRSIRMHQHFLDFIILLGDNFYYNGVKDTADPQWDVLKTEFPQHVRLYPVLGNHDYHQDASAQISYSSTHENTTWKMPFYYYDEVIPLGNETIHFFLLTRA